MNIAKGTKVVPMGMFNGFFLLMTKKKQLDFFADNNEVDMDSDMFECYHGLCFQLETNNMGTVYIVCIHNKEYRTLVHELAHLADMILDEKGIPNTTENTEIRAYLIERLFEESCKALKLKADF